MKKRASKIAKFIQLVQAKYFILELGEMNDFYSFIIYPSHLTWIQAANICFTTVFQLNF